MNSNISKIVFLIILIFLLAIPNVGQATTLGTTDIAFVSSNASDSVYVWGGSLNGVSINAGVHLLNKSGGSYEGNIWDNGTISGFCIELAEPRTTNTIKYNVISPQDGPVTASNLSSAMGSVKANYLSELWGRYYDSSWATTTSPTIEQNYQAASFALAIWEIVEEDLPATSLGWDVGFDGTDGDGGFKAFGIDYSLANEWLNSLDGTGPMADLRVLSSSGYQDYLVAVPEPAAILFMTLGSIAVIRKRRNERIG